ncbi:hypothetical protein JCM8115_000402, partial [Rhodotorula mucilaginosa]
MPTPLSSVREEAEDSSSDVLGEQTISAAAASSARSHSRIHSRNLSVFFPRPTPNQDDKSTPNAQAPQPHAATGDAGPSDLIPPISARGPDDRTVTRPAQRRGHHHRHSVSLAISPSEIPRVPPILARDGTGTPPQEVGSYASGQGGSLSQQGRPVPPLALVLSIAQIAVGAYLWIKGQRLESLSTTGLGYVVVFDGIAVVLAARLGVSGGSAREGTTRGLGLGGGDALGSLRRPYGGGRLHVLSHFAQSIYLLFSAIYISKESVEHVLLLSDAQGGAGAHVHGHGATAIAGDVAPVGEAVDLGLPVPATALLLGAVASIVLAVVARNHVDLAGASRAGLPAKTRTGRAPPVVEEGRYALNRFTLLLVAATAVLLCAAVTFPRTLFLAFDKAFALLEAFAIVYVARPAAVASARTLLQAAPGSSRAFESTFTLPE